MPWQQSLSDALSQQLLETQEDIARKVQAKALETKSRQEHVRAGYLNPEIPSPSGNAFVMIPRFSIHVCFNEIYSLTNARLERDPQLKGKREIILADAVKLCNLLEQALLSFFTTRHALDRDAKLACLKKLFDDLQPANVQGFNHDLAYYQLTPDVFYKTLEASYASIFIDALRSVTPAESSLQVLPVG